MSGAGRKDASLNAEHQKILKSLLARPENKECADCHTHGPRWASTNLGVFLCIGCSGLHRKMGTHVSVVRSTTLDTWTPQQIESIQRKGNAWAKQKFEAELPPGFRRPTPVSDPAGMERFVRDKYERRAYFAKPGTAPPAAKPHAIATPSTEHQSSALSASERRPGAFAAPAGAHRSALRSDQSAAAHAAVSNAARQRAATVIRLNEMGFTTGQATLAIEQSGCDLESALAWLLENPSASSKPAEQAGRAMNQAPIQAQAAEKVLQPAVQSAVDDDDDDDDWADFSGFQTAPAQHSSSSTQEKGGPSATQASNKSSSTGQDLMSLLGELYVQKPPNAPAVPDLSQPPMRNTAGAANAASTAAYTPKHNPKLQNSTLATQFSASQIVEMYSDLPPPPVPRASNIAPNSSAPAEALSGDAKSPEDWWSAEQSPVKSGRPQNDSTAPSSHAPASAAPPANHTIAAGTEPDLFADLDPMAGFQK